MLTFIISIVTVYWVVGLLIIPRATRQAVDNDKSCHKEFAPMAEKAFNHDRRHGRLPTKSVGLGYGYRDKVYDRVEICKKYHTELCTRPPAKATTKHLKTAIGDSSLWPIWAIYVTCLGIKGGTLWTSGGLAGIMLKFINRKDSSLNKEIGKDVRIYELERRNNELEQELKVGDYDVHLSA